MNADIFNKWLLSFDARMIKLKKKIILFLDNFSGHKIDSLNLENIRIEYYPPNCTSILQPLDQGIIRAFKNHYRAKMLNKIISKIDRIEVEEDINVLDALWLISAAWSQISAQTITNCFSTSGLKNLKIAFPLTDTDDEEKSRNDLMRSYCDIKQISLISFDVYATIDDKNVTQESLTDEEIVKMCQVQQNDDIEDTETEAKINVPQININTALLYTDSIKKLLNSFDLDNEELLKSMNSIQVLDGLFVKIRLNTDLHQKKIEDYFHQQQL